MHILFFNYYKPEIIFILTDNYSEVSDRHLCGNSTMYQGNLASIFCSVEFFCSLCKVQMGKKLLLIVVGLVVLRLLMCW